MKIPLEVTFRGVEKSPLLDELIREKAAKLEQSSRSLIGLRLAVERPQQQTRSGSPFRVRIQIMIPGNDLVVKRESGTGDMHAQLPQLLREAFDAAHRQLKEFDERRRGKTKSRPETPGPARVVQLFPGEGYGFLASPDGAREIYFHRNSVLRGEFDKLAVGTAVRFVEEEGDQGPQASTVEIIARSRKGPGDPGD